MTDRSFLFDFSRVDDFFENFNVSFFIDEMWQVSDLDEETGDYEYSQEGTDCYQLILCKQGGDNIDEYLDEYGCLDETALAGNFMTQACALDWYNKGDGEATIELHDTVQFTIGDSIIPLKAVLLRDSSTGYVMGYCINMQPFTVTNKVIFDSNSIFWDISRSKE